MSRPDEVAPAVEPRPRLWTQAALIGVVLWAYDAVNNYSPFSRSTAFSHASTLVRVEMRLHLDPEFALNRWLSLHVTLGRALADFYDLAHFAVTLTVLAWIWWRFPSRYRPLRNALLGINAIGFVIFWAFPVAPPRMLTWLGFTDIVAVTHAVGSWSTGALASQANEFAAMPSLHVAWALWCAGAVWLVRKDWISRAVAVAYAVGTSVIVLATANHYFLDVAAGAATAAVAYGTAVTVARRRERAGHERVAAAPS